jgi:hypothetical protein
LRRPGPIEVATTRYAKEADARGGPDGENAQRDRGFFRIGAALEQLEQVE